MFAAIAIGSQYIVVLQEAELFLQTTENKEQRNQLVSIFNNQPDGIIITSSKHEENEQEEANPLQNNIVFELCNQSVTKILGFVPSL